MGRTSVNTPLEIISLYATAQGRVFVEINVAGHRFTVKETENGDQISCSCGVRHRSLETLAVIATALSIKLETAIEISCYSYIDRVSVVVKDFLTLMMDPIAEEYDIMYDSRNLSEDVPILVSALLGGVKETLDDFFKIYRFTEGEEDYAVKGQVSSV